jgi:sulfite dehydrogenase (cytochrome) subunit A
MHVRIVLILFISFLSCQREVKDSTDRQPPPTPNDQVVTAKGKKPLRLLTDRPPNLETPLHYFQYDYTPNDVFFVRWHLAGLPSEVDTATFRLKVYGHVKKELSLSLDELRTHFKPYTVTALVQCAGNSRCFFDPQVPGGQWKHGGMGNAKWTGVKLKDILEFAGVKAGAKDVSFNGLDEPPLPSVPDFIKSLQVEHAMDGEVMVAYLMNDEPLPLLNGFPLKLVVPGWYATYWIGMLSEIKVYADTFKGFWMQKAYLVPKDVKNGNERPDSLAKEMQPISKMDVRSIFVTPEPDSNLVKGRTYEIQGLAFDGGDGIVRVEVSADSGITWAPAKLDRDLGKYSWRRWRYAWAPQVSGTYVFKVRATNTTGETQPEHQWNRSGYMRNEIERLELRVR